MLIKSVDVSKHCKLCKKIANSHSNHDGHVHDVQAHGVRRICEHTGRNDRDLPPLLQLRIAYIQPENNIIKLGISPQEYG